MTSSAVASRVGKEECAHGNDDVCHHAKDTLEVVGLAIAQEGSDDQHGENESNRVEDGEGVGHVDADAPANQDSEWGVEKRSLDRSAHDVGQSHVDLVVVGLVDSQEMFCRLLLVEIESLTYCETYQQSSPQEE